MVYKQDVSVRFTWWCVPLCGGGETTLLRSSSWRAKTEKSYDQSWKVVFVIAVMTLSCVLHLCGKQAQLVELFMFLVLRVCIVLQSAFSHCPVSKHDYLVKGSKCCWKHVGSSLIMAVSQKGLAHTWNCVETPDSGKSLNRFQLIKVFLRFLLLRLLTYQPDFTWPYYDYTELKTSMELTCRVTVNVAVNYFLKIVFIKTVLIRLKIKTSLWVQITYVETSGKNSNMLILHKGEKTANIWTFIKTLFPQNNTW